MAAPANAAALELAEAVEELLGTLDYYIGPNARSASNGEDRYWRLVHAHHRVVGDPCPTCGDTGIDRRYSWNVQTPCALADLAGHPPVPTAIVDGYARYRQAQAERRRREGVPSS